MLAVADEEGYVSIFSTQKQLPNFVDTQFRTGAHSLCVFPIHQSWADLITIRLFISVIERLLVILVYGL